MISKALKFTDHCGEIIYLAFDLKFQSIEKSGRTGLTSIMMPSGRQYLVTDDADTVKRRFDEAAEDHQKLFMKCAMDVAAADMAFNAVGTGGKELREPIGRMRDAIFTDRS